jgi:hypothetical protein
VVAEKKAKRRNTKKIEPLNNIIWLLLCKIWHYL